MNTHQHTRTYFAETSAKEMQASVTLAGPCMAPPITAPKWTRPVSVEIAYRTRTMPKVVVPDKPKRDLMAENRNGKSAAETVKAERAAFHLAPGREKMQGLRFHGKSH